MQIYTFPTGPFATNVYLLFDENTKEGVIIDPGVDSAEKLLTKITEENLTVNAIWLTHSHWDHIGDVATLKEKLSLPIFIHKEDIKNLENPGSDGIPMPFAPFKGASPDHLIDETTSLTLGKFSFSIIHTPGHSPGSVCFYCKKENLLISGDTLFKGAIGALSLPTSQPDRMWKSLQKLSSLPSETKVFPGHGPSTNIKEENWLDDAIHNLKEEHPTHITMSKKKT